MASKLNGRPELWDLSLTIPARDFPFLVFFPILDEVLFVRALYLQSFCFYWLAYRIVYNCDLDPDRCPAFPVSIGYA
jgi:hypothetical protein